jgi:hypothetical protein
MISTDTAAIKRMTFHADDVCTIAQNNKSDAPGMCVEISNTFYFRIAK